ncbi:MAG TPA: hypothetical protein VK988_10745, partial [Acidimicrobiales bacterium]|nr:hypothetical protein [Acidimicrobiales bacterium]
MCGGVEYTITSGNGKWAVGKDTESSTHFIPSAFTFTMKDAGGDVVFQESLQKKGHRNHEQIRLHVRRHLHGERRDLHVLGHGHRRQ